MTLKPGTLINDRYKIIEQIGIGGMAVVYRAADEKLERDVTLKILKQEYNGDEDFIKRFNTEARAAAKLTNTNIVSVYDVGTDGNVTYIVMEYVNGFTLKELIQRRAPFDDEVALGIAIQIASGLEHAHNHGIIHRDVKPENILITKDGSDGTIKVTDFGIAKAANSKTTSTNAMGSVHYFSPEQAKGDDVDTRTDIYSLGIVLYEMITGTVPFDGDSPVALAMKHITEAMPDARLINPKVTDRTLAVIDKATQKLASERYQTIGEMLIDLKAAAGASYTEKMKDEMQLTQEELDQISKKTGDKYKDYDNDDSDVSKRNKDKSSSDDIPQNKIKERNTVIAAILTGLLLVVLLTGIGAWFMHNQDQNTIKVPNFIGLDVTAAEKLAESKGITIEENEDYNDEYDKDTVFYQSVRKGKRIDKTQTIVLKISKGKNVIDMPSLLDLSLSEAIEVIKSSGLILADTQYVASDKEIGTVVSQSINAGVKVAPDTEITISVSEGKSTKSIPVPDVENMEVSKAKELLEDNNLIVNVEESFSSTIDKGNVISQSIEGGTEVTEGTEILLTVSKGVDPEEESELVSIQESNEENVGKHVESEGEETTLAPVTEAQQQQKTPKSVSISVNPDINSFTPNDNGEYNVKITAKNAEGEKTVVDRNYSAGDFPFSVNDTILDSTNYEITINGQHYNSQSADN